MQIEKYIIIMVTQIVQSIAVILVSTSCIYTLYLDIVMQKAMYILVLSWDQHLITTLSVAIVTNKL